MEFCPECGIGLSNVERQVGYCRNCHYDFNEDMRKENKEWDGVCRCGHKHSEHGKSGSINYTAGRCSIKGCNCKYFLHEGMKTPMTVSTYVKEIDVVLNEAVDKLSEKDFLDLCMDIKHSCDIRLNGEHKKSS